MFKYNFKENSLILRIDLVRTCPHPLLLIVTLLNQSSYVLKLNIDENETNSFLFRVLSSQPGLPPQNFSMSVTVPVSSPNALSYTNPGSALVSPSLAASSTLDSSMLSPPQATLHRNVSPGAPQRPPSTGSAGTWRRQSCRSFTSKGEGTDCSHQLPCSP